MWLYHPPPQSTDHQSLGWVRTQHFAIEIAKEAKAPSDQSRHYASGNIVCCHNATTLRYDLGHWWLDFVFLSEHGRVRIWRVAVGVGEKESVCYCVQKAF